MAVRAESPSFQERRVSPFKGKHHTIDARERMKAARGGSEYRELIRKQQTDRWKDPDYAERMKDSYREMWKDETYRQRMLPVLAKARAKSRATFLSRKARIAS